MRRGLAAACLLVVAAAGCGSGDDGGDDVGSASTTSERAGASPSTPGGVPPLADVAMTLTEVAEAESPLALVDRPGTDTLYVAEPAGGPERAHPALALGDVPDLDRGSGQFRRGQEGAAARRGAGQ